MTEEAKPFDLASISPEIDKDVIADFSDESVPEMSSPEWPEFVLGKLTEDELIKGAPTTDGLRRVATLLLGDIIESYPITQQSPNPTNDNHAVIEWRLRIRFNNDVSDERIFGDVADVYSGNTPEEKYSIHSAATAATKAEGRALRKALMLKRILTYEEAAVPLVPEDPSKISNGMIEFINMMCSADRLNLNVQKIIKTKGYNNIKDLPYGIAVEMRNWLQAVQNGTNKKPVPDSLKGYDPNWRLTQ